MTQTSILVVAGEHSGDMHGAHLVEALRRRDPGLAVLAAGGEHLRAAGAEIVAETVGFAAVGAFEALRHAGHYLELFRTLKRTLRERRPDAVVLIDYPDFNLRLAPVAHALGIPVVYYICPQVWAWRKGRVKQMARLLTRAIVIFPFEEAFFRENGVDAVFVGHPLVDIAAAAPGRDLRPELGWEGASPVVGLMPGSRRAEFDRLFPVLSGAAERILAERPGARFLLARGEALDDAQVERHVRAASGLALHVHAGARDVLKSADVVLTKSGTSTVEAAIAGCPMVVTYKLSFLTWLVALCFLEHQDFAMANLIAGRRIVPELMQWDATPENVAREGLSMLDPDRAAGVRAALAEVRERLGAPGAADRAAGIVLDAL